MEVTCRSKKRHIEIRGGHFEHGSGIGENMPLAVMCEQDGDASGCAARDALHARGASTPFSASRSSAMLPSGSLPMRDTKPTEAPNAARLCATIAEELPSVIPKPLASSSRSVGITSGRPYRIKSILSSPAMLTSKRFSSCFMCLQCTVQIDSDSADYPVNHAVRAWITSG